MSIFSLTDILNSVFNKDAKKLKVETDVQISSVTATDVTIHDAVATDNKLKVNEDGSVPVELKGSNVQDSEALPVKQMPSTVTEDVINKQADIYSSINIFD